MTLIIAKGASGVEHKLWAHPAGTALSNSQGVYAFCSLAPDGVWDIYYVGKADGRQGLNGRVGVSIRSHHKFGAAEALGATHVAAAAIDCDEAQLCWVENDIIQGLQPPLNEKAPPGFGLRGLG